MPFNIQEFKKKLSQLNQLHARLKYGILKLI